MLLSAKEAANLTQEVRERNEEKRVKDELISVESKIFETAQGGGNEVAIRDLRPQTLRALNENHYKVTRESGFHVIRW